MAIKGSNHIETGAPEGIFKTVEIQRAHNVFNRLGFNGAHKAKREINQSDLIDSRIKLLTAHMKVMSNPDHIARAERTIRQLQAEKEQQA
ncbi:hypothetical protein [Endozoicomonas lisbonensis]|uniref:hypothetical protein n=1 Tax=Endozoicomonas lisbonensis TaxID=3120522 RepID=UPI003396B17D